MKRKKSLLYNIELKTDAFYYFISLSKIFKIMVRLSHLFLCILDKNMPPWAVHPDYLYIRNQNLYVMGPPIFWTC